MYVYIYTYICMYLSDTYAYMYMYVCIHMCINMCVCYAYVLCIYMDILSFLESVILKQIREMTSLCYGHVTSVLKQCW